MLLYSVNFRSRSTVRMRPKIIMIDCKNNIYFKECMQESLNKQYARKIHGNTGERQGNTDVRTKTRAIWLLAQNLRA
jgi:hypothetical protein